MKVKFIKIITKIGIVSLILTTILFLFWKPKNPLVKEIKSYNEIVAPMREWNEKTLVLFDVDDTLITTQIFHAANSPFSRIKFFLKYPRLLIPSVFEHYLSLIWQKSTFYLIEPQIVEFIKDLEQRGCNVLGLTSMESGKYGVMESMPEWRFKMLKNFSE